MGDVIKATKTIIFALEDLTIEERGRVMRMLAELQDSAATQAGPSAQERRKPGRPRKSDVAKSDPKGSGEARSARCNAAAAKREGRCPDHRDRILQLLQGGPMKTSDLISKLKIKIDPDRPTNNWEWRVNVTALQQAGKIKMHRTGKHVEWSLA